METIVKRKKNLKNKLKVWVDFLTVGRIDIHWIGPAYHYLFRYWSDDIESPRMPIC